MERSGSISYADGAKPIGIIAMVSISSATGMALSWDAHSGQAYDVEHKTVYMELFNEIAAAFQCPGKYMGE